MERYAQFFSYNGLFVVAKELDFNEDSLLIDSQEYYSSPGFRARIGSWGFQALNGPIYNANGDATIPDVFRFCLDKEFRKEQLDPKQPLLPTYKFSAGAL